MANLSPPPGRGGGAGSLASRVVKGGAPPDDDDGDDDDDDDDDNHPGLSKEELHLRGSFVIVCLGEMVEQKEKLQCCHEEGCFCIVHCTGCLKKSWPHSTQF